MTVEPGRLAEALYEFLSGAVMLGLGMAGLFFLRFWKQTRDRLFLLFSISFLLMGAQRVALLVSEQMDENRDAYLYGIRIVAFLLILAAIMDKNRESSRQNENQSAEPASTPGSTGIETPS